MDDFLKGRTKIQKDREVQKEEAISIHEISLNKPIFVEESKVNEPKVEVISEDGIVKKISITCSCGQKIELQCNY